MSKFNFIASDIELSKLTEDDLMEISTKEICICVIAK